MTLDTADRISRLEEHQVLLRASLAEKSVQLAQHETRIRQLEHRLKLLEDWGFWIAISVAGAMLLRWLFS